MLSVSNMRRWLTDVCFGLQPNWLVDIDIIRVSADSFEAKAGGTSKQDRRESD